MVIGAKFAPAAGGRQRRLPSGMSTDATAPRFERPLTILPEDIDGLGHVNNVVYLRWAQDIATAHWEAAATPEQQERLAWVALRHEIDYKHPALPGDDVLASTLWCPITRATGRVTRVDDAVRSVFSRSA
jgi:acyl-CoA thioester hydrolase